MDKKNLATICISLCFCVGASESIASVKTIADIPQIDEHPAVLQQQTIGGKIKLTGGEPREGKEVIVGPSDIDW